MLGPRTARYNPAATSAPANGETTETAWAAAMAPKSASTRNVEGPERISPATHGAAASAGASNAPSGISPACADKAAPDSAAALHALAQAYLDFADQHPAVYEAMFVRPTDLLFGAIATPLALKAAFNSGRPELARPEVLAQVKANLAGIAGPRRATIETAAAQAQPA